MAAAGLSLEGHAGRADPALEARDVRVTIGDKTILHSADLTLEAGRLVAVVGPNGAGKSTLARAVAGMQKTAAGAIRWMGEDLSRLHGRRLALTRAFVPQRARVPDGVTVTEAVRIGRSPHLKPLQRPAGRDHAAVASAIERAGVTQFADRKLTTLSGGELQRVQIAVALAQEAPVLMADEPTSHLDLGATVAVAKLLRGLADEGLAVMLVAHDLSLAAAVADTVVVMSEGRTVAAGPPLEALSRERLEQVWGVDASVQATGDHTALHVAWLGAPDRLQHDS
jgi:iron complex transport system ATP-binding protein